MSPTDSLGSEGPGGRARRLWRVDEPGSAEKRRFTSDDPEKPEEERVQDKEGDPQLGGDATLVKEAGYPAARLLSELQEYQIVKEKVFPQTVDLSCPYRHTLRGPVCLVEIQDPSTVLRTPGQTHVLWVLSGERVPSPPCLRRGFLLSGGRVGVFTKRPPVGVIKKMKISFRTE